jgi:hypothetical protein
LIAVVLFEDIQDDLAPVCLFNANSLILVYVLALEEERALIDALDLADLSRPHSLHDLHDGLALDDLVELVLGGDAAGVEGGAAFEVADGADLVVEVEYLEAALGGVQHDAHVALHRLDDVVGGEVEGVFLQHCALAHLLHVPPQRLDLVVVAGKDAHRAPAHLQHRPLVPLVPPVSHHHSPALHETLLDVVGQFPHDGALQVLVLALDRHLVRAARNHSSEGSNQLAGHDLHFLAVVEDSPQQNLGVG